jgi:prevent-host-death family protein
MTYREVSDMKGIPVAELKRDFRKVLDAAERGEKTLILRRGRPVAAIVPVTEAESARLPAARVPGGLLSLVGALHEWDTIDADVERLIQERESVEDRPPVEFD